MPADEITLQQIAGLILATEIPIGYLTISNALQWRLQYKRIVNLTDDVPGGEKRGGHAYYHLQEFIVALSGSFDVVLHDGEKELRFHLNRSYYGLYVPKMYWRELENFSTNSLALILADNDYNEDDYIRNFDNFKTIKNGK